MSYLATLDLLECVITRVTLRLLAICLIFTLPLEYTSEERWASKLVTREMRGVSFFSPIVASGMRMLKRKSVPVIDVACGMFHWQMQQGRVAWVESLDKLTTVCYSLEYMPLTVPLQLNLGPFPAKNKSRFGYKQQGARNMLQSTRYKLSTSFSVPVKYKITPGPLRGFTCWKVNPCHYIHLKTSL